MEQEEKISPNIKYVIYKGGSNMWRIQCAPIRPGSFELRVPFPEEWRGLSDETLQNVTKVPDSIFVHHSGWIAGNRTLEGSIQLAQISLLKKTKKVEDN